MSGRLGRSMSFFNSLRSKEGVPMEAAGEGEHVELKEKKRSSSRHRRSGSSSTSAAAAVAPPSPSSSSSSSSSTTTSLTASARGSSTSASGSSSSSAAAAAAAAAAAGSNGRRFLKLVKEGNEAEARSLAEHTADKWTLYAARESGGSTPLHFAAKANHQRLLELLLDPLTGGRVCLNEQTGEQGNTALHLAAKKDAGEATALLLAAGASPLIKNHEGRTPHSLAVVKRAKRVLKAFDDALLDAAQRGAVPVVDSLLGAGVNALTLRDAKGRTPLHVAAAGGSEMAVRLIVRHGYERLQQAPAGGGGARDQLSAKYRQFLDARDDDGWTPLLVAIRERRVDVVRLLLLKGADPSAAPNGDRSGFALAKKSDSNINNMVNAKYVCPFENCSKESRWSEDDLLVHVLSAHGGVEARAVCPICAYRGAESERSNIGRHLYEIHGPDSRRIPRDVNWAGITYLFTLVVVQQEAAAAAAANNGTAAITTTTSSPAVSPSPSRFLVVQKPAHAGTFLPGGRVEPGLAPTDAAVAMVKQQSGIDVRLDGVLRIEYSAFGDGEARMRIVFYATPAAGARGQQPLKSEPDCESVAAAWCDIDAPDPKKSPASPAALRCSPVAVDWFKYVAKRRGPVHPLSLLTAENAPVLE